jgi:hypothetical protein
VTGCPEVSLRDGGRQAGGEVGSDWAGPDWVGRAWCRGSVRIRFGSNVGSGVYKLELEWYLGLWW